ncbi:hypothetical protein BHF68_03060 [Desulfuribacillus alkaliarsenatis]|uniref:NodB homology domain-containing protein n=2 Tax=Desulfuribacillus alkaliarsenatis TaxID=766136 RepID=A0A1E5G6J6_9FIRM|nr:hypothetical protein BHF68_03060 [Desulfuribacillus alkaliarsenatis]
MIIVIESTWNVSDRLQRSIFGVSMGVTLEGVTIQRHLDHEIRNFIESYAREKKFEAENARIDSIWKGIPGINGIEVDIEKTLNKALSAKRNEDVQFQYRQWEPEVQLKDLGAVPIYRGNSQKQAMALMINVSWGTEWIENILEILEENNVKVTFFVAGDWVEKNHEMLLRIYFAGHEIGSHAYTHRNMSTLDKRELAWEMQKTDQIIQKTLPHITTRLFAPPSGDFNQQVVDVAHSLDKYTVLWTLDTIDWQRPAPSTIVNRIVPKAENGALVLMHPTEPTVEALKTMIPKLSEKGYKLLTVSELLSSQRNDIAIQSDTIGFP